MLNSELQSVRKILEKLIVLGSSNTLAQGLLMVYSLIVARRLGPEAFGVFTGSYSLIVVSAFLVNWGLDIWLLREASYTDKSQNLLVQIIQIKIGFLVVWGSLMIFLPTYIRPDFFERPIMIAGVLDIGSELLTNSCLMWMNAQKKVHLSSKVMLFSRSLRLVGAILLIIGGAFQAVWFAWGRALATGCALILAFRLLDIRLDVKIDLSKSFVLWKKALPYGISEFLALIYAQSDVTLFALIGKKIDTGYYSTASSLINAMFVVPNAVYLIFVPYLVSSLSESVRKLKIMLLRLIVIELLVGVILTLLLRTLGPWLIQFALSAKYQTSADLLFLLSPLILFKSLSFGLAAWIVATNRQQYRIVPQLLVAILGVLVNLWGIPRYGVIVAVYVYLSGEILLCLGYAIISWFTWKQLKLQRL